jgi:hypothetical protein
MRLVTDNRRQLNIRNGSKDQVKVRLRCGEDVQVAVLLEWL